jgi:hypothetical protein
MQAAPGFRALGVRHDAQIAQFLAVNVTSNILNAIRHLAEVNAQTPHDTFIVVEFHYLVSLSHIHPASS